MQGDASILVEVAGPGVTPETVASRELLALADAYLVAAALVAQEEADARPRFTGLAVVAKCAAVLVHTDMPDEVAEATQRLRALMSSAEAAPKGLRSVVGHLRAAVRALPASHVPSVRVRSTGGERVFPLLVERPELVPPPHELLEMRALPLRAGGSRPLARFEARGEQKPFTLEAESWEVVRRIGAALMKPCSIVARVARDVDGSIVGGRILEFQEAVTDSREAWERWYRENADLVQTPGQHEGWDS